MATLRETTRQWDAPDLKKNTFDLTHNHPLTANLGRLFPVFTETMPANTSLHVNPSWSFKIKPFLQDMQTNIKCHFQLWRVPVRIIWDNFERFSRQDPTQNTAIAHPYIARDERWVNVGELADYFGIPSQTFATRESGVYNRYDGFGGSDHKSYNEYGSLIHPTVFYSPSDYGFKPFKDTLNFDYVDRNTPYPCPVHGVLVQSVTLPITGRIYQHTIYGNGVSFHDMIKARNRSVLCTPASDISDATSIQYSNYICIEQPITMPLQKGTANMKIGFYSPLKDDISNSVNFGDKCVMLFKGATPSSATYFGTIYAENTASSQMVATFSNDGLPCVVDVSRSTFPAGVPFVNQLLQNAPTPYNFFLNTFSLSFSDDVLNKINSTLENEPLWCVLVGDYVQSNFNVFLDPYGFQFKSVESQLADMGDCPYTKDDGDKFEDWWNEYNRLSGELNANTLPNIVPLGFQSLHNISGLVNETSKHNVCGGFANLQVYQNSSTTIAGSEPFTPFEGRTPKQPISALPFRAFEAIYNFRYRVKELDPFTKDGVVCVDDWNTNHGDGADSSTPVHIDNYRVSYPEDYFFGAMPKPSGYDFHQVLVGVTEVGGDNMKPAVLHFAKSDDDKDGFDVNVSVKDDGTIGRIDSYSEDADHFTINVLKDGIQYGIPAQAFAFSEAMNKWYEATYKGGRYSWGDFIKAHFGHPATHIGLRHPEFIGGCTYNLDMTPVQNTNSSGEYPLGYQASVGSFQKNDGQGWTVYTDEESIVIGVMYFTLEPINSQSIPKFWLRSQPSDYPTPELANLGTMEITKREIAPLQCDWSDGSQEPFETFGYVQNYNDLCHKWDYASGLYRTQFAHNLYQRVYGVAPVISAELLKIRPDELTCPYQDGNEVEDPIYGVVHLDVRRQIWLNQSPNQITM